MNTFPLIYETDDKVEVTTRKSLNDIVVITKLYLRDVKVHLETIADVVRIPRDMRFMFQSVTIYFVIPEQK